MLKRVGPIQQKILVLCITGIGLAFSASPKSSYGLIKTAAREWRSIDHLALKRSLRSLCREKLLVEKKRSDGTVALELTEAGKRQAKYLYIFGKEVKIQKPKKWDRLWRVVIFDIPEETRRFRDILRNHLKQIGFRELQHSVFIFPYPCEKELAALVNLYNAERYVQILTVKKFDNEQLVHKLFPSLKHS